MTSKHLLISAALFVLAASSPPPSVQHLRPYSSINYNGKKTESLPQREIINASASEQSSSSILQPIEPSKVIVKLASALTTPEPVPNQNHSEEIKDGCKCEKMDSCPIEMMDFRFAVSCQYGTVRCCRPQEVVMKKPDPVVVKRPNKKPVLCKCKSRKECDWFFNKNGTEAVERKDDCPSGSVLCCETGNMGNPKEASVTGNQNQPQHVLGNTNFQPIQLPYLKMPKPNNQRISETDPLSSTQELQSIEETPVVIKQNLSTPAEIQPTTSPLNERPEQQHPQNQAIQQPQQPFAMQFQQQQVRPLAVPPQIPQTFVASTPLRHPQQQQQQHMNQPGLFNIPVRQQQGPPLSFSFQQPPVAPAKQQPMRPATPFRQPILQPPQQFQQQNFQRPQQTQRQPSVEQPAVRPPPFGLSVPPFTNNPQQHFGVAPPQQVVRPAVPSPTQATFQQLERPTQQPPQSSSGGFFSSLMSIFT